jgi:MFS family permease
MVVAGRHSDRTGERRWHVALAAFGSALGFGLSAWFHNPVLALAALALAFAGIKSTIGPFWAFSTPFLRGNASAGGIALINSLGSLGGFFGPWLVGLIVQRTHNNFAALLFLGSSLFAMGVLALIIRAERPAVAEAKAAI